MQVRVHVVDAGNGTSNVWRDMTQPDDRLAKLRDAVSRAVNTPSPTAQEGRVHMVEVTGVLNQPLNDVELERVLHAVDDPSFWA